MTDEELKAKELADRAKAAAGKLIDAGVRRLGLRAQEVLASKVDAGGVATIVTIGGHKVRFDESSVGSLKELHPLHAGRSIKPTEPPKA